MSIARKSLLTLAAVGESKKDPPPTHFEIVAAPSATVCIYVLGTAICVSK